ncbi:hypothetical protein IAR50_001305 [Cryptococcus sp. DSM 104548]
MPVDDKQQLQKGQEGPTSSYRSLPSTSNPVDSSPALQGNLQGMRPSSLSRGREPARQPSVPSSAPEAAGAREVTNLPPPRSSSTHSHTRINLPSLNPSLSFPSSPLPLPSPSSLSFNQASTTTHRKRGRSPSPPPLAAHRVRRSRSVSPPRPPSLDMPHPRGPRYTEVLHTSASDWDHRSIQRPVHASQELGPPGMAPATDSLMYATSRQTGQALSRERIFPTDLMLPGEQRHVPGGMRPSPTLSKRAGLPSLVDQIQAEAPPYASIPPPQPGEELLVYSLNFSHGERDRLRHQSQTTSAHESERHHQRRSSDNISRPKSNPLAPLHPSSHLHPGSATQPSTPPNRSLELPDTLSGDVLTWNYDTVRAYWMGYASGMKDTKAGKENAWERLQKQGRWEEIKRRHAPYPYAPSPPRPPSPELATLRQAAPAVINSLAGMRQQQPWRPPPLQVPFEPGLSTPVRPRTVPPPARQYQEPGPYSPTSYSPRSRQNAFDVELHGQKGGWGSPQPVYFPNQDQPLYSSKGHLPTHPNMSYPTYPASLAAGSPRVHPPPFPVREPSHYSYYGDRFNLHRPGDSGTGEQPRVPRKRQLISCYPCRKRKLRCDGRKPICEQCERRKVASGCGYAESVKRRGKGKSIDGSEDDKKDDEGEGEGENSEVAGGESSRVGRHDGWESYHPRAARGRSSSSSVRPLSSIDADFAGARQLSKWGHDEEIEERSEGDEGKSKADDQSD